MDIKILKQKAIDFLEKYTRSTNPKTNALNAEFALGGFYAIANIIKENSLEDYIYIASETVNKRAELHRIVSEIRL